MGPIAFVLVFLLIPLLAALLAIGFFATVGIARLVAAVPTGLWAGLTVAAGLAVGARLLVVLRALQASRPGAGQGPHP